MTTIEERLAFVEGRVAEYSQMFSDLREAIAGLERRMDARFTQVEARLDRLEGRFDQLRVEMSRNFRWVVGIQVTTLITVVATLLGALAVRSGPGSLRHLFHAPHGHAGLFHCSRRQIAAKCPGSISRSGTAFETACRRTGCARASRRAAGAGNRRQQRLV